MKKLILFSLVVCGFSTVSLAQTAVYVCQENGAYGFCYGNNDVGNCAYNKCLSYGGKAPRAVLTHDSKGYGAIAVGKNADGRQIVGAAAGHPSLEAAKNRAKKECSVRGGQNIYIADTFNDK